MRWRDLVEAVSAAERAAGVSFDQYEVTVGVEHSDGAVEGIEVVPGVAVRIVSDLEPWTEEVGFW